MLTEIADVTLFVKALSLAPMKREDFDALPDRQSLRGLPVDGVTYRDAAFPRTIFHCNAASDWSAYNYDAFSVSFLFPEPS